MRKYTLKNKSTKPNSLTSKKDQQLIQKLEELKRNPDKNKLKKDGKELLELALKGWLKHEKLRMILSFLRHVFGL